MERLLMRPKNLDHFEERKRLIRTLFKLWLTSGNEDHLNNALKVYNEARSIFLDETRKDDATNTYNPEQYWNVKKLKKVA